MATKKKEEAVVEEVVEEEAPKKATAKKAKAEPSTDGSDYWHEYRNVTYVKAYQEEAEGDYTVQGQRGDVWTVPADQFHANYKPVTPNKS